MVGKGDSAQQKATMFGKGDSGRKKITMFGKGDSGQQKATIFGKGDSGLQKATMFGKWQLLFSFVNSPLQLSSNSKVSIYDPDFYLRCEHTEKGGV